MSNSEQVEVRVAHTNVYGNIVDITGGGVKRNTLAVFLKRGIENANERNQRPGEKIPMFSHQMYAPSWDKFAVLRAITADRKP